MGSVRVTVRVRGGLSPYHQHRANPKACCPSGCQWDNGRNSGMFVYVRVGVGACVQARIAGRRAYGQYWGQREGQKGFKSLASASGRYQTMLPLGVSVGRRKERWCVLLCTCVCVRACARVCVCVSVWRLCACVLCGCMVRPWVSSRVVVRFRQVPTLSLTLILTRSSSFTLALTLT